jgi:hypothetical protein
MRYTVEARCRRNSRRDRIHCPSRAALGSRRMQASGRELAVLAGQAAEEAGARPRRGHVSTVMDIEAIRLSRFRGCCPTRQAAAIWVIASMGKHENFAVYLFPICVKRHGLSASIYYQSMAKIIWKRNAQSRLRSLKLSDLLACMQLAWLQVNDNWPALQVTRVDVSNMSVSIATVADKACLNNSVTLPFVGGQRCFGVLLPFGRSFYFLLLTYWAFEVLNYSPHFLSHHELLRPCIYPAGITMWTSHLETIPCWGRARGEGFDAALAYSQY